MYLREHTSVTKAGSVNSSTLRPELAGARRVTSASMLARSSVTPASPCKCNRYKKQSPNQGIKRPSPRHENCSNPRWCSWRIHSAVGRDGKTCQAGMRIHTGTIQLCICVGRNTGDSVVTNLAVGCSWGIPDHVRYENCRDQNVQGICTASMDSVDLNPW